MEPTQSERLYFSCTYSVEAQRWFEVHEHKGSGVERETRAFELPSSNKPRSPLSACIAVCRLLEAKSTNNILFTGTLALFPCMPYAFTGVRGGAASVAI